MRHPFKVYRREDSDVWWWSATIGRVRVRQATTQPKDANHKGLAEQEAGAAWLGHCSKRGVTGAVPAGVKADTYTLITLYCDTPLKARAKKRNSRYREQIATDLCKYVKARFPQILGLTAPAWRQWMDENHGKIKLRSIQRITSSANLFLQWCAEQGHIPVKPTLPYPSSDEVASETADRRAFTKDERDRFLAAMKELDGRAWRIYTVLLYTGLRKSGLERMRVRWIDKASGFVTFPARSLKDSRRPRTFYLRKEALSAIEAEPAQVDANVTELDRLVFGPFDYDGRGALGGLFWKAVDAAGIDPHGLTAHHITRHTACTIAGLEGATLAELMALGGWSSPQMAARYMHIDAAAARRAVERL